MVESQDHTQSCAAQEVFTSSSVSWGLQGLGALLSPPGSSPSPSGSPEAQPSAGVSPAETLLARFPLFAFFAGFDSGAASASRFLSPASRVPAVSLGVLALPVSPVAVFCFPLPLPLPPFLAVGFSSS